MKFQVGDRVKFLNEKGGGVVKRLLDSSTVEVTIEEGFDVPVRISELIISEPRSLSVPKEEPPSKQISETPATEEVIAAERPVHAARHDEVNFSQGVYLAFWPHNQKLLISGMLDVVLVNHTGMDVLYNVFAGRPGKYVGIDYGSIGPEASVVLDSCEQQELSSWMEGVVQLMFHVGSMNDIIAPVEVPYKIKQSKLIHAEHFVPSGLMEGRAFISSLWVYPAATTIQEVQPQSVKIAPSNMILKHKTADGEAEVDLHIHALVEDESSLDAGRMMQIQLDYVARSLDSAIQHGFKKVVYIHGVGAGILKIELRKLLESYDCIEFFDASIARYGIGATEVLIYQSKK
jgi:hypothetical protein